MTDSFLDALAATLLPGDVYWPSGESLDLASTIVSIAALVAGHTETLQRLDEMLGERFTNSSPPQRHGALSTVEREHPAVFAVARLVVFDAYYRHPTALAVLANRCGYRAGPPQPAGFPRDRFDPSALDTVRTMEQRWRSDTTAR